MSIILRRRKLGKTSCREVARFATPLLKEGELTVLRNDNDPARDVDWLFRWGCTSQQPAKRTVNTCAGIAYVNDKKTSRLAFAAAGLSPKSWGSFDDWRESNDYSCRGLWPTKLIVRPQAHSQGRYVHLCAAVAELAEACAQHPHHYISEYIEKDSEYRVFVAQGRAVWVAKKTPGNPDDVAWNVARGGRFDNVRFDDWPLKAVRIAIEAFNMTGLDFGGVDVMGKGDDYYVLEINSAPSQTSPYRQECTAKVFAYMINNNSKDPIPLSPERGGWKKFIHPAISDKAVIV